VTAVPPTAFPVDISSQLRPYAFRIYARSCIANQEASNFFSSPSSPINIVGLTFATALLPSLCSPFVPDISTKPQLSPDRDSILELPSISALSLPETKQKHLKHPSGRAQEQTTNTFGH
jgi:hypothetical protein